MPDTAEVSNPSQIYEAIEGFVCDINGEKLVVQSGITHVAGSHELVKRFPNRFRPIGERLTYPDSEVATAVPGERRDRVGFRANRKGATSR